MSNGKLVTIHSGVRIVGRDRDIVNLQLEELAVDPANPQTSRIWLNTTEKRVKVVVGLKSDGSPDIAAALTDSDAKQLLLSFYSGNLGAISGTSSISFDNSVPGPSEGSELFSQTVIAKKQGSKFVIDFSAMVDSTVKNRNVSLTVWRDSTLIGYATTNISSSTRPEQISIHVVDELPEGVGSAVYSIRCGNDGSGTWYLGRGYLASMGGANRLSWTIAEVMA